MSGTEFGTRLWEGETLLWSGRPPRRLAVLPVSRLRTSAIAYSLFLILVKIFGYQVSHSDAATLWRWVGLLALVGLVLGSLGAYGWTFWLAPRTTYLVTNRRLLILRNGRSEPVAWIGGDELEGMRLAERRDGTGDITFRRRLVPVETFMLTQESGDDRWKTALSVDRTWQLSFVGVEHPRSVCDLVNRTFKPWREGNA